MCGKNKTVMEILEGVVPGKYFSIGDLLFNIRYECDVFVITHKYESELGSRFFADQFVSLDFPHELRGIFSSMEEALTAIIWYLYSRYKELFTPSELQEIKEALDSNLKFATKEWRKLREKEPQEWEKRIKELAKEHEKMSSPYVDPKESEEKEYIPLPIDPTVIPVIRRMADMMTEIRVLRALAPVHCGDCVHLQRQVSPPTDTNKLYGFCSEGIKNHPKFDRYFDRTSFYCGLGEKRKVQDED